MNEYKQYPDDVRTVFYLAQTCECLGKYEEAYTYYKLRSTMGGFHEEVYESCVRKRK